jgi:hypothetical protein
MSDYYRTTNRGFLMRRLIVQLTFVVMIGLAGIGPASAQSEPQTDPFWSLLAMVPDYDGSRAQLSYVNLQAIASIGDAAGVTLTDVREKTDAGNRWWQVIAMAHSLMSDPMFSVVRTAMFESEDIPGMETLLGFTLLDIQQGVFFTGVPPDEGHIVTGSFDLDAIRDALSARDFEAQEIGGVEVWCWVEGCDQGYRQDITNLQPGNIFGGMLGRREPLAIQPHLLLDSPSLDTMFLLIGAQEGLLPTLDDAPEYGAFAEAAMAQGTVVQAFMMDADVIRDMMGRDVLREWNLVDIALPSDVKERAVASAREFGVLPSYHLFGFAQTWQDGAHVTHLIVIYENVETAEIAANEIYDRLTNAASFSKRAPTYNDLLLTDGGEILPASVYEGEHGAAAIFSVRASPENADDLAALARPFQEFTSMISSRDLYFMGTEFVLPE